LNGIDKLFYLLG